MLFAKNKKKYTKWPATGFFLCLLLISTIWSAKPAFSAEEGGFHIHDTWVREAPPGFTILAAYLVFENHSDSKVIVTGVTSPAFERVEMHVTSNESGTASMSMLNEIVIGKDDRLALQPGGSHLMMYEPKKPLRHGDDVIFIFTLKGGKTIKVKAKVKKVLGQM